MFRNMINYAEIIYTLWVEKCCEALSRLALAEIEVLYFDGSHAWIKDNMMIEITENIKTGTVTVGIRAKGYR